MSITVSTFSQVFLKQHILHTNQQQISLLSIYPRLLLPEGDHHQLPEASTMGASPTKKTENLNQSKVITYPKTPNHEGDRMSFQVSVEINMSFPISKELQMVQEQKEYIDRDNPDYIYIERGISTCEGASSTKTEEESKVINYTAIAYLAEGELKSLAKPALIMEINRRKKIFTMSPKVRGPQPTLSRCHHDYLFNTSQQYRNTRECYNTRIFARKYFIFQESGILQLFILLIPILRTYFIYERNYQDGEYRLQRECYNIFTSHIMRLF